MNTKTRTTEDPRLVGVVLAVVAIGTLYFARSIFIPLALALLLSFPLSAPVIFLERMKIPRALAIFTAVVVLFGLAGVIGWKISLQVVDISNQLPAYRDTLQEKINAFKGPSTYGIHKASDTMKELEKAISSDAASTSSNESKRSQPVLGSTPSRPLAVEIVPPLNPLQSIQKMLGPLATALAIIVFTVFILAGREDLRNRLIRLAGGGHLNIVTQAIDEATQRINRYLLLQLLVNSGYGLLIGISLQLVGLPNAALLGLSAAVLRFLPYLGPPLAALFPAILALAVFHGWGHVLITLGIFVVLELIVANILEPVLYGAHLGLSPLAVLVAAVFWTLIWGFPGLVLSTPLTVCLVVIGRYVPGMNFVNVLFGDQPVLASEAHYYQRLLAGDQIEARQVVEECLKETSLPEVYGSVVIPALMLAEQDYRCHELDTETRDFIYGATREITSELGNRTSSEESGPTSTIGPDVVAKSGQRTGRVEVLCVPAKGDADEVVAMMLSQSLCGQGQSAEFLPASSAANLLARVDELAPTCVCISALAPFAVSHARTLYLKLRACSSKLKIIVCLWQVQGDPARIATLLKLAEGDEVFTSLPQVLQHLADRSGAPVCELVEMH